MKDNKDKNKKRLEIRNSTAEFLIFQLQNKEEGVEVMYKNETLWLTQKAMATLFDVNIPAISKHLQNIFENGELAKSATVSKMKIVRTEGERQVARNIDMYNLDAVISVGYRVNSVRATQFRQWYTAAEIIEERANAEKEHMGLTSWEKAPNGKIVKTDVSIAKYYLKEIVSL